MQEQKERVVVCERAGGNPAFHACVDGQPQLWEAGHSKQEAVERLRVTHGIIAESIRDRGLVTLDMRNIE